MPLLLADQRSDAWIDARRGKITASLAAAILGVDSNKGQLAAYREIVGPHKDRSNKHTEWGNLNEPKARAAYEIETGRLAIETGFWLHPTLDWLGASPDGLVDADGVLEVKCPGELPTEIPVHHKIQIEVQLACTDREWGDYFAWTPGGHFLCRVVRDREHEAGMLVLLQRWYEQYVATGTEPPRRRSKA